MKTILTFLLVLLFVSDILSQNIAITDDSSYTAHSSAVLDVKSDSRGFLVPRLTSMQIGNINQPATGLLIFQTDEPQGFFYNDGTPSSPNWLSLSTSSSVLWLKGTAGTTTLLSNVTDSVGIGTVYPEEKLDVNGNLILDNFQPLILFKEDSLDAAKIKHFGQPVDGYLHLQAWDGNIFEATGLVIKAPSQDVGIGTVSPSYKLDVIGTTQMEGFILAMPTDSGYILTSDANGVGTWQSPASHIAGSGSTNFIPKFSDTDSLVNSIIFQDTTGKVGIGTTSPGHRLSANGMIESIASGFKFPDGTIQTTAATSGGGGGNGGYSSDSIFFGGPETAADGRWYIGLQMYGIQGSWTVDECDDCSKVFDLEWSIYIPYDAGTGLPQGTRKHTALTVIKNIDKASVLLIQKLITGSVINDIKLKFYWRIPDPPGFQVYYTITLMDVRVVDFQHKVYHTGNEVFAHLDQVTFVYNEIIWEWIVDGIQFQDTWGNQP